MRFRRLQLRLQTTDGPYGATLDFPDGLVVVWADNTMGKSTCVKSILVALGMEAMLGASQSGLPLPPAVTTRLESSQGHHDVLESEVFLEIEGKNGERIVIQRTIKGERDKNLVTVHNGPVLTSPGTSASTVDYFVSRPGAATRELGFHYFLTQFLEWDLPTVQTYDGNEYPLYLQCVFPYFVVEQTRGWSSVQPPLPTHFRIRDAHKRAVEFILNLDAHRVALKRQEVLFEKSRLEAEWSAQVKRVTDLSDRASGAVQALPQSPVAGWPPLVSPALTIPDGDQWITIKQRMSKRNDEWNELVKQEIPRVQEIATTAENELNELEELVRDKQTLLSRLLDSLEMEEGEVSRIEERLDVMDVDAQRNKDVRIVRQLGSRKSSSVDDGTCPICHQSIHDSLVPLAAEQAVMSLDENIQFLDEQKRTYQIVIENARRIADARNRQVRVLRDEISSLRNNIRAIRQTLISDGRLPSIAAIQARIGLETSIRADEVLSEQFIRLIGGFEELAARWSSIQEQIQGLPKDDVTEADRNKIGAWADIFREQLDQYGFQSFPVDQVFISPDSYKPEHAGFDMEASFAAPVSLQASISASDLIRTIWSYLHGFLELSRTTDMSHPGTVIFDEPRQQSTRDVSFAELLRRGSTAEEYGQQVIFFTSESQERLQRHLKDLPHTYIPIEGRVLTKM